MTRLTEEDLDQILKQGHCSLVGQTAKIASSKSKGRVYRRKVELDGHLFDSKAEALIYSEFKLDPDIEILELQPKFVLLRPFKRKNKFYKGIGYTSDFRINIKGVEWIVEVKSKGTIKANSKSYPMRRKLFLNKFPDLNFKEIIFDGLTRIEKDY